MTRLEEITKLAQDLFDYEETYMGWDLSDYLSENSMTKEQYILNCINEISRGDVATYKTFLYEEMENLDKEEDAFNVAHRLYKRLMDIANTQEEAQEEKQEEVKMENSTIKEKDQEIKSLQNDIEILNRRIDLLQKAVIQLMEKQDNTEKPSNEDIHLSRVDFLAIYNHEMEKLSEDGADESKVYGNDVTVHWAGLYCNCGDGATAYNHIIGGIESVEEEDEEYF